jgi:hypothetical protein
MPAPYLQSLAHLHSLKLFLEQQQHHVARNILQASLYGQNQGNGSGQVDILVQIPELLIPATFDPCNI